MPCAYAFASSRSAVSLTSLSRMKQLPVLERCVELGEPALEERDAAVPDGVGDARMHGVERPRPRGDRLLGLHNRAHVFLSFALQYLRTQTMVAHKHE